MSTGNNQETPRVRTATFFRALRAMAARALRSVLQVLRSACSTLCGPYGAHILPVLVHALLCVRFLN